MPASWLRRRRRGRLNLSVVGALVFVGRDVVGLAVQSAVVVTSRPIRSWCTRHVDGAQRAGQEWAAAADGFGLEQSDRRHRSCVVAGVADTPDGCRDLFQDKGFGERDGGVLTCSGTRTMPPGCVDAQPARASGPCSA